MRTNLRSLNFILGRLRMRQLVLLTALNEHGSILKAAEATNMTPPAATKALHEIEDTVGAPLFERLGRTMAPTMVGQCVLRYSRLILADMKNLREEVAALLVGQAGKVTVGSIMAAVPILLTRTIASLNKRHPSVTIEWHVDTSQRLLYQMLEGKIDLVIGRVVAPYDRRAYDFELLNLESLVIVSRPGHPLAGIESIQLKDLMDYPWTMLPGTSPFRDCVEQEFQHSHLPLPFMPVETPSVSATIALLQETDMISVLTRETALLFAAGGLIKVLPVELKEQLAPYGIVTTKGVSLSPAVQMFLAELRDAAGKNKAGRQTGPSSGGTENAIQPVSTPNG